MINSMIGSLKMFQLVKDKLKLYFGITMGMGQLLGKTPTTVSISYTNCPTKVSTILQNPSLTVTNVIQFSLLPNLMSTSI